MGEIFEQPDCWASTSGVVTHDIDTQVRDGSRRQSSLLEVADQLIAETKLGV